MKYLLYVDAVLAALGAAMTLPMIYLCLVYSLMAAGKFPGALPTMRNGLDGVIEITVGFALLMALGGLATWALWKRRGWMWPAQGALALWLPVLYFVVRGSLQSA